MFLTKSGGIIVKPLSILLGKIISWIYDLLCMMGVEGIGVTIIVCTALIRLVMIPMMVSQNKSSKIMAYIQPEINKITKKYKGKKDQESMLAQQREVREVQNKYGASMSTGCLMSLIQLPIFMAFYRVIYNIPAYVDKVKDVYKPIVNAITGTDGAFDILQTYQQANSTLKAVTLSADNTNTIIDVLAKIPSGQWSELAAQYSAAGMDSIANSINDGGSQIAHIYNFLGAIDLTTAPGFKLTIALIIPILSLVFQFLSMHATPQQPATDPAQEQQMKSMKTMMNVMPIMSFFITVTVPAGVGLYWATGSLLSFLTTVGINLYFKKCDMEKVVEKSKVKAAKKQAKKDAKGKQSFWDKMQEAAYGTGAESSQSNPKVNSDMATKSLKSYTSASSNKDTSNGNVQYRKGSLASKANIMQRYNDSSNDSNNGGK
jgi:YidC/Oxa1 family membrane protein insertase